MTPTSKSTCWRRTRCRSGSRCRDDAELRKHYEDYNRDLEAFVDGVNSSKPVISIVPVGMATLALREKIVAAQCLGIEKQLSLPRPVGSPHRAADGAFHLLPLRGDLPEIPRRPPHAQGPLGQISERRSEQTPPNPRLAGRDANPASGVTAGKLKRGFLHTSIHRRGWRRFIFLNHRFTQMRRRFWGAPPAPLPSNLRKSASNLRLNNPPSASGPFPAAADFLAVPSNPRIVNPMLKVA